MPVLKVEMHVKTGDRNFVGLAELANDEKLLQTLSADPSGGLSITDDVEMVLIDDHYAGVADFFLETLPDLLREGRGGTYQYRTGPETASIYPQGESVVIMNYDGTCLETTTVQLLECLALAEQDNRALQRLIDKA